MLNSTSKSWKKEPQFCYQCGNTACTQIGEKRYWYCFRCAYYLCADDIDDGEIDDTLQVCHEQLEIQSKEFNA